MNNPEATQTSQSTYSAAMSLDLSSRYAGMIELSTYKKTRNNLFQLFDYVTIDSPPFWGLHVLISYLRIIQIFGPAFLGRFYDVWGENSLMKWVNDVVSVLYTYVPASLIDETSIYLIYIIPIVFLFFYIFLLWASNRYEKEAQLPPGVTTFIAVFFGILGYLFPTLAIYAVFVDIGQVINGKIALGALNIVGYVLTFVTTLMYAWVYSNIYSVSIMFKPDSLQTVIPSVQVSICICNLINYGLLGIGGEVSRIPQGILVLISAVNFWLIVILSNRYGGMVNVTQKKIAISTFIAAGILLPIAAVFIFCEIPANEVIILLIAGGWIVAYIIYYIILQRTTNIHIAILDLIEEDPENFDYIRNPNHFSSVVIDGMRAAHPVCLNWSVFKSGIEAWPKNVNVWFLFAKFTAIYAECTQQLDWISVSMIQNRLKGSLAKHTLQQIQTITRQRETNLIPSLKSKLDKIGKQVQSTKHKVRYVWDLIIQGNVHELESGVQKASKAVESCESEFQHLLRMFPNSRFVARIYARFLCDVVADYAEHQKWQQNITNLQRGQSIFPDQTHEFGLRAFPLLPKSMSEDTTISQGLITDDTLTQEIEVDEDQAALDGELRMTIKESINRMHIPAYSISKVIYSLLYIILFIVPVVALTIVVPVIHDQMFTPLNFMEHASSLRSEFAQLLGLAHHMVMEQVAGMHPLESYGDPYPEVFGSFADTKDQLELVAQQTSNNVDQLAQFITFQTNNENMNAVRDIIFEPSFNFTEFRDDGTTNIKTISMQMVIMKYIVLIENLVEMPSYGDDMLSHRVTRTLFTNFRSTLLNFDTVLETINGFIISYNDQMNIILYTLMGVLLGALLILNIAAAAFSINRIKDEKMTIYKSIASLPKNVVSRVSDTFKVLKKNDDDGTKTSQANNEEMNKQEENLLKIFTTSTDNSRSSTSDSLIIIITTTINTIFSMVCVFYFCYFLVISTNDITDAAPHVNYMMGSYSNDFCSLIVLNMLACTINGKVIQGYTEESLITLVSYYQERGIQYYNAVRYGNASMNAQPFSVLDSTMLRGKTPDGCSASLDKPTNLHSVYRCWNPDVLTSYVQSRINSFVYNYMVNRSLTFDVNDDYMINLWHMHLVHLYQNYYNTLFQQVLPAIQSSLDESEIPLFTIVYVLLVLDLINIGFAFYTFKVSEERQKFALRLLLHCPANVVMQNANLSQIIAGNFSLKNIDSTTRDTAFYDELVRHIPNSVITTDMNGTIMTANHSTGRTFGIDESQIIGKSIHEFAENFEKPTPFDQIGNKQFTAEDEFQVTHLYHKAEGDDLHIEITLSVINDSLLISMRDNTQSVMYNKLISDERAKSDKLLASILPPRLVPRVQAGEQNISFAVQTVSVLFMDIVSFTPWCGSNTATFVMSTLNKLFKYIDNLVTIHPTMTKIKCIGDCYMAAAGIFAEVNQPAVHAKDITEFGLEAIETLGKLNEEINQDLKIRVGINTGGPIVAGVFTTGKPTFEILGPTINMAQQMEHHGVPMKVHISRAVYELIYGGNFIIKERGEVEVKKGTVVTYLVEGKR